MESRVGVCGEELTIELNLGGGEDVIVKNGNGATDKCMNK
jgi:hypothetical protein